MAENPPTKAPGVRARVRAELTASIKESARRQLVTDGAAGLSLRAIARELDMASSAIYRYYASRDELLTALIIDAYNDVGEAIETAEATIDRHDVIGRWSACTTAFRDWAVAHPHEYALIYGSPVPGYAAPEDTIIAATRVPTALLTLLGEPQALTRERPEPPQSVLAAIAPLRALTGGTIPAAVLAAGIAAWGQLLGMVTLELFGHLHNVVEDYEALFEYTMAEAGRDLFQAT